MADAPTRPDTSDMAAVHRVFRTSLAAAPTYVSGAAGDDERRALIANYYANVLAFLEAHHDGEELIIFTRLAERAPAQLAAVDKAKAQHEAVHGTLAAAKDGVGLWQTKGDDAAGDVVRTLRELDATLTPHLDEEEAVIVPLAAEHMSAEEWGMLPAHGLGHFTGDKVWLILGLIRENMTQDQRDQMLVHMPPPARQMWEGMGEAAFSEMIGRVRQTT